MGSLFGPRPSVRDSVPVQGRCMSALDPFSSWISGHLWPGPALLPHPTGPQNPPSPIRVPVLAAGPWPHPQLVLAAWGPGQASPLLRRCCLKPLDSDLAIPPTLSQRARARLRPSQHSGAGDTPGRLSSCWCLVTGQTPPAPGISWALPPPAPSSVTWSAACLPAKPRESRGRGSEPGGEEAGGCKCILVTPLSHMPSAGEVGSGAERGDISWSSALTPPHPSGKPPSRPPDPHHHPIPPPRLHKPSARGLIMRGCLIFLVFKTHGGLDPRSQPWLCDQAQVIQLYPGDSPALGISWGPLVLGVAGTAACGISLGSSGRWVQEAAGRSFGLCLAPAGGGWPSSMRSILGST